MSPYHLSQVTEGVGWRSTSHADENTLISFPCIPYNSGFQIRLPDAPQLPCTSFPLIYIYDQLPFLELSYHVMRWLGTSLDFSPSFIWSRQIQITSVVMSCAHNNVSLCSGWLLHKTTFLPRGTRQTSPEEQQNLRSSIRTLMSPSIILFYPLLHCWGEATIGIPCVWILPGFANAFESHWD